MRTISDADALERCTSAVKRKLENPLTFSRRLLSTRVSRAPTLGNVPVEFPFEAKTNLGASLPAKAQCILTEQTIEAVVTKQ
jgi:hypothetical protein